MARPAGRYAVIAAVAAARRIAAVAFAAPGSVPETPGPKSTWRVAVVPDAAVGDEGWGESALNAARFIESKYGFEVVTKDNVPIADIEPTLKKYAESHDLVIAHGIQWGDPALRVGSQHPDVEIVVFTGLTGS